MHSTARSDALDAVPNFTNGGSNQLGNLSEVIQNAYKPAMFDDIDVNITKALYEYHDFDSGRNVQFSVTFKSDDDKEWNESYSLGPAERFTPSADGTDFEFSENNTKGLSANSNFYKFVAGDLKNAGFDLGAADKIGGLGKSLLGARVHVKSEPVLDENGAKKTKQGKDGKTYDRTRVVITKIVSLPWDKSKKSTAPKAKAAGAAANATEAPAEVDGDLRDEVITVLLTAIADKPQKREALAGAILRHYTAAKNPTRRKQATDLLNSPDFLTSIDGTAYDGSTLSMAA